MSVLAPARPSAPSVTGSTLPRRETDDQMPVDVKSWTGTGLPYPPPLDPIERKAIVDFKNVVDGALAGDSALLRMLRHSDRGIRQFFFDLAALSTSLGGDSSSTITSSSTLSETIDEIRKTESWGASGDEYDPSPDPLALAHAAIWIRGLHEQVITSNFRWIKPNVTVGSGGRVVFEWWNGEKALGVYVSGDDAFYVYDWGSDVETEMQDGDAEPLNMRRSLWAWLMA